VGEDFPGYNPANITVQSGTTVRWNNVDLDEHTTTSPGNWDSGEIPQGGSFQTTLIVNGTYNYFCLFHVDMAGSVTVIGGPTATPQVSNTIRSLPAGFGGAIPVGRLQAGHIAAWGDSERPLGARGS
jgi:hypothetical protein